MGYFIRVQFVHQLMNSSFIIIYPSTCLYSLSLSRVQPSAFCRWKPAMSQISFNSPACCPLCLWFLRDQGALYLSFPYLLLAHCTHAPEIDAQERDKKGVKFVPCLGHLGILFCHTSSYPDGNGLWTFSLTFSYSSHWQVHYFLTTRSLCQG